MNTFLLTFSRAEGQSANMSGIYVSATRRSLTDSDCPNRGGLRARYARRIQHSPQQSIGPQQPIRILEEIAY